MYHKGNRESMDCMDDIVLIQASGVENDTAVQDLKVEILMFFLFNYYSFFKKPKKLTYCHCCLFYYFSFICRQHVK